MGVGGNFWDLLKPYARHEPPSFLLNKRVAVDLSYWIVQHDAAIRSRSPGARSPHLRTTFFRTVALFSKMGALPVFVVDGEPDAMKSRARMERFFRGSGVDTSGMAVQAPKERNQVFARYVRECVELLQFLGMPVLKARSEAEALCAQLNYEGHVDACITADSDAFLFGAKCVIKCLRTNAKEPFECYHIADVEAGLGLRRKQMIAISLLVGNDHNLHGVPGFGVETAVRFVKLFSEDEIFDRLSEVGKGGTPLLHDDIRSSKDLNIPSSDENVATFRLPHCSLCGHPGNKRDHSKLSCEYCIVNGSENCVKKPTGFKCICSTCDKDRKIKEQKKQESWQIKVCKMIAAEHNFPNNELIEIYLSDNNGSYDERDGPSLRWDKPQVEDLVDFLAYHQHWEPSYIRQRLFPMLSINFLREVASTTEDTLLLENQYEFHSIERVKIRYGHSYYLIKWKRAGNSSENCTYSVSSEQSKLEESEPTGVSDSTESEPTGVSDSTDMLDEPDVPLVLVDDGDWFLLSDENMELVQAAFPSAVDKFLEEKRIKESLSKKRKSSTGCFQRIKESLSKKRKSSTGSSKKKGGNSELPRSSGVQLSITEFYRAAKVQARTKACEDLEGSRANRKNSADLDKNLLKSVRRRLLFD